MGTHPIFESDFDCLTENGSRKMNSHIHQLRGMLESSNDNEDNQQQRYQQQSTNSHGHHHDEAQIATTTNSTNTAGPPPAFLNKLWQLVNDQSNRALVSWSSQGRSFIVHDQVKFAKAILPNYFKHQKMNSFIRQLNMYGFKKVPKLNEGTLHASESDQIEFANEFFIRDEPDLLSKIKRKDGKRSGIGLPNRDQAKAGVDNETLTKLLHELSEQQKQTHRDFDQLKEENQDLYRQVGRLRQKHDKQQDTVQRLITFMIHYFQSAQKEGQAPRITIGGKRPYDSASNPLMLTDGSTRITADEYTPNNSFDTPNIIVPPDSPLSEAIKRARLPLDDGNDYLIKDSGNTIMSSDPSAPIISDVTDDKTDQIKPHVTEPAEEYFDLEPSKNQQENSTNSQFTISTIKRSMSRQDTTLSSIIGMVGQQVGDHPDFLDDFNLDDFTAG